MTVPRVVGMGKVRAVQTRQAAGLVAEVVFVEVDDPADVGRVVAQVPIGNKVVSAGSTVTISVGTGKG
ncbi:hypothetical protein HRbin12_00421 [bacterium HR12]|nr:hypothetical protein HRbin12_00421 [bacterium HR12]